MESKISSDFKRFFLLTFTQELVRHSEKRDILKLQSIIETRKPKEKRFQQPLIFTREIKEPPIQIIEPRSIEKQSSMKLPVRQFTKPLPKQLFIPEPKLPEHLEYLKPIPSSETEIDLFKINPLIKDPGVRIIEANPEERVIVIGTMGTKPTDIILSKEDVDRIINAFSEESKIPITEGIYRVVVGNLILSAIISDAIGSRFTIKKMITNPNPAINKPQQQMRILPFQNI